LVQSSEATWTGSGFTVDAIGFARAQVVCTDPRNAADQEHCHGRDRPDQHLEAA
jgi:hypothetical protein